MWEFAAALRYKSHPMDLPPAATAAALVVGNEILSGKIEEKNLAVLARFLREHGVELLRTEIVPDELGTIADATKRLAATHDWVFTSGGVGPTHDDVTIEAVARAFGKPASVHPDLKAMLEAHYGDRLTEAHLRMALAPEGAILERTAEVAWPVLRLGNVWMLPGVPEIFRAKVLVLAERLPRGQAYVSLSVLTHKDESEIKALLDDAVAAFPDVSIGSYPRWHPPGAAVVAASEDTYRTKITFDGRVESRVFAARNHFQARLTGLP